MKINVLFDDSNENKKVIIKCSKYDLLVSKDSQKWNIEGINEFLINISTTITDGDRFEVVYDENNKDEIYKYVCSLFIDFKNQYNLLIDKSLQKNG